MPKPLAEIAIDAGLASRDQVVEASRRADSEGEPLVVALVRRLAVDQLALVSAIRRQMRVPLSDPATVKLDPDALREVSRDVCRRLRVLPLSVAVYDKGPRMLRLAMADPTDAVAIAEIEHLTGCRVDVTLMPLAAIEEMVEDGYREFVTEVINRKPAFGGNLQPARPPVAPRPRPAPAAEPADDDAGVPTTMPYHRLSDEADIMIRHRALLELLLEKKLISEDEFEEKVRQLMRRESGEI